MVIIIAGLGIHQLVGSHAATPYASVNAYSGLTTGSAQKQQPCVGSIIGNCVVFGSGSSSSSVEPIISNGQLATAGSLSTRLKMRGVTVWGITDSVTITGNTGSNEYQDRAQVIKTIQAWGGNVVRLRLLACDYNSQKYLSNSQELQQIKDWVTSASAAHLYVDIAWWDPAAYDCPSAGGSAWANDYSEAFPMMDSVISTLGPTNQWVIYEPFNEPNNIADSSWLTAMEATDSRFRKDGYMGVLVFDTNNYSHEYDGNRMSQLLSYDTSQTGMNSKSQAIFAKHDYANEYGGNTSGFNSSEWPTNTYNNPNGAWQFNATINNNKIMVWETEFGNYNNGYQSLPWAQGAASWMAAKVNDGTLVGATAFVFNWVDPNSIVNTNDITPTMWGTYVESNFLKAVN